MRMYILHICIYTCRRVVVGLVARYDLGKDWYSFLAISYLFQTVGFLSVYGHPLVAYVNVVWYVSNYVHDERHP